jgi:hypothetical protein
MILEDFREELKELQKEYDSKRVSEAERKRLKELGHSNPFEGKAGRIFPKTVAWGTKNNGSLYMNDYVQWGSNQSKAQKISNPWDSYMPGAKAQELGSTYQVTRSF